MTKYVGYLLNGDTLSRVSGAPSRVICRACFARLFGVNGHRVPRPVTRRALGIVDLIATNECCSYCNTQLG